MTIHRPPRFELRRRAQLRDELVGRSREWLHDWRPRNGRPDFAAALLEIAARLETEVTQRLDRVPEKNFRGFLHWLGVRGKPGRAAELPVVFSMAAGSPLIDAPVPVQLQALGGDVPVIFETVQALRMVPGRLATLVGADPENDAFYLPPASVFSLEAPPFVPREWQLLSDAGVGATRLQLSPELGLESGLILRDPVSGGQYRVTTIEGGIIGIDPRLGAALELGHRLVKVNVFGAFDEAGRNRQEHALYLGADSVFNIKTEAVIEIVGGALTLADAEWTYSGEPNAEHPCGWLPIESVFESGRLFLLKPAGAIESKGVNGVSNRWLRAEASPEGAGRSSTTPGLRLRINCAPDKKELPIISGRIEKLPKAKIELEGIANTAPLVLNQPFYPLGREPRLFDTFYLGCPEAFSKPEARVTLKFDIDYGFSSALSAIALPDGNLAVGIGADGKLHRLWQTEVISDESKSAVIAFLPSIQPLGEAGQPAGLTTGVRPGAASWGGAGYVTAAAGKEIWLWTLLGTDAKGAWKSLGAPVTGPVDRPVETILLRLPANAGLEIYALAAGNLYRRPALINSAWSQVSVQDDKRPIRLARIAPVVHVNSAPGELREEDGIACVSEDGEVFLSDDTKTWQKIKLARKIETSVYPLAVKDDRGRLLCFAKLDGGDLLAIDLKKPGNRKYARATLIGHGFSYVQRGSGDIVATLVAQDENGIARPMLWDPFGEDALIMDNAPAAAGTSAEAPLNLGAYHLFPGANGVVGVTSINADLLQSVTGAALADAGIFHDPDGRDWSTEPDLLIDFTPESTGDKATAVAPRVFKLPDDGWAFDLPTARAPTRGPVRVHVHRELHHDVRQGRRLKAERLELAENDRDACEGAQLYVRWRGKTRIVPISKIEPPTSGTKPIAVLAKPLPRDARTVNYQSVKSMGDFDLLLRPSLDISALRRSVRDALPHSFLQFSALLPRRQSPVHILAEVDRALLGEPWTTQPNPGSTVDFTAAAAFSDWRQFEPARAQNPKLSWEYWDGNGWWRITGLVDRTDNLLDDGEVEFTVPSNLKPTEVVGRTNYWIRARLVSGDYGQEKVTVESKDLGDKRTEQTVIRNTDSLRPPYVNSLDVHYQLCTPVAPEIVLTRDSGAIRDQTDANRTAEAVVEHFVPLGETLSRFAGLENAPPAGEGAKPTPMPDCVDCGTGAAWTPTGGAAASRPANTTSSAATAVNTHGGRALYLGFDAELKGGPISILFLVDEGRHDDAFPLRVDALIGDRFQPVTAEDGTRGLNESGVVSLTLSVSPQLTNLFGEARYWLRLRPNRQFNPVKWQPRIRGAWLNATMATATETQTLEMLASSDGSPAQRVTLARPPVLADSLELRVRERLSDEDVAVLRRENRDIVLDALGAWPGPWVLWREVPDVADSAAGDRHYALDSQTGEIGFGDGINGLIPPIGRDVIAAARYQRVAGAAANEVMAWSQINLITPLQGVESAVAPDGSAGGADPEDALNTIRFAPANLRLRDRVLTLRDFEQMTLQFSPDIAQVRAFPAGSGVRLVVMMRGLDPIPSRAIERELKRYLAQRAPPMLSIPDVLQIRAPDLIFLRLSLILTVPSVEFSGVVAAAADARIRELLDPATGGHDGTGWQLGAALSDTDIAAALVGIPHLEGIVGIARGTVNEEGDLDDFPAALRPTQLLRPDPIGVVVEFLLPAPEEMA